MIARVSRVGALWSRLWPPTLLLLLLIVIWALAVYSFDLPAYLVPSPSAVLAAARERSDALMWACWITAQSAFVGLLIAALFGVAGGAIIASSRLLLRGAYPIASFLQMVPLVAIAPLLVIWLGYGSPPATAAAALVALFPVLANTIDGLRAVDPTLREVFALHKAPRLARWWKLELPSAVPGIVTGLRVAAGLSVIGAIVGEFVCGYGGDRAPIGMVVMTAMRESRTDLVFAAIALSSMVGLLLFAVVNLIGVLLLRKWHPSADTLSP
ncbi:MAG: ABC transporter permease [Phycisphaerales bacterium]|nr:ABC transporter permease [Phycisphaerales bacterium]